VSHPDTSQTYETVLTLLILWIQGQMTRLYIIHLYVMHDAAGILLLYKWR
jgi:hypothetical protein